MTTYSIKCSYKTGDSFKTYNTEVTLEMIWKNLENAKRALARIRDHYLWYEDKNSRSAYSSYFLKQNPGIPRPDWHKKEEYDGTIIVVLDNTAEVKFSAPWCGYFERLYSAEIVINEDPEWKVEFE